MQITLISDTHGCHDQLNLQGGDMLIHAGDVCNRGIESEVVAFLNWFKNQKYKHKIFIAGNHDWFFERSTTEQIQAIIPKEVIYLNDSGVCIDGFNIWGSPIQPAFFDWAFNRKRGTAIDTHWQLIPKNTDILITHGPPFGILDKTMRGEAVGCEMLLKKVNEIKPKLHVFGHIHEGYGMLEKETTTFVNASVLDIRYNLRNEPVNLVFEK
ncbi:metallophosphatase domain-containing protein [Flavobacterium sp.]|uniref:metallophosphatase domain-containing protein n=1 Tax=Flavobacterium sp. TaxID=239 RepID=UPI0037500029